MLEAKRVDISKLSCLVHGLNGRGKKQQCDCPVYEDVKVTLAESVQLQAWKLEGTGEANSALVSSPANRARQSLARWRAQPRRHGSLCVFSS